MIHEVISLINDSVSTGLNMDGIENVISYGICDVAIVNRKNTQKSFPAIFDVNGEGVYPFLDDRYLVGWYHRVVGNRYLRELKDFGRIRSRIVESEMMMVVWGFSKELQKSKYEVEEIIRRSFHEDVVLSQTTFDSLQIFNREFKGYKFNIRPEEFVFSIQYKVRYRERC